MWDSKTYPIWTNDLNVYIFVLLGFFYSILWMFFLYWWMLESALGEFSRLQPEVLTSPHCTYKPLTNICISTTCTCVLVEMFCRWTAPSRPALGRKNPTLSPLILLWKLVKALTNSVMWCAVQVPIPAIYANLLPLFGIRVHRYPCDERWEEWLHSITTVCWDHVSPVL